MGPAFNDVRINATELSYNALDHDARLIFFVALSLEMKYFSRLVVLS